MEKKIGILNIAQATNWNLNNFEHFWNNSFVGTNTSARHSMYNPHNYSFLYDFDNPAYFDEETNTSYHYTFANTYFELSTEWMNNNPTWKYDINACVHWLPAKAFAYANANTTTQ
jgi:hypothetical protein